MYTLQYITVYLYKNEVYSYIKYTSMIFGTPSHTEANKNYIIFLKLKRMKIYEYLRKSISAFKK